MKLFLKISFLLVSFALHAQTGGIYEINNGKKGVKLFDSSSINGVWTNIISLNLNNDGLSDLLLIDLQNSKLKPLSVKDKIYDVEFDNYPECKWNIFEAVDFNGDLVDEIVIIDSSGKSCIIFTYSTSDKKFSCDSLKSRDLPEKLSSIIAVSTDNTNSEKLLIYCKETGKAFQYVADQNNTLVKYSDELDLGKDFDLLIETSTNGDKVSELMLLNQKDSFYKLITFMEGAPSVIADSVNINISWDNVVNGNFGSGRKLGDFVFIDTKSGKSTIYKLSFDGFLVPFRNSKFFISSKWDNIVSGKFSHNYTDGLLLYKKQSGH